MKIKSLLENKYYNPNNNYVNFPEKISNDIMNCMHEIEEKIEEANNTINTQTANQEALQEFIQAFDDFLSNLSDAGDLSDDFSYLKIKNSETFVKALKNYTSDYSASFDKNNNIEITTDINSNKRGNELKATSFVDMKITLDQSVENLYDDIDSIYDEELLDSTDFTEATVYIRYGFVDFI